MIASVLVEIKSKQTDKVFYYNIPSDLKKKIMVGIRVIVPFGNRKLEGFVLEMLNDNQIKADFDLKDIIDIVDKGTINFNRINRKFFKVF